MKLVTAIGVLPGATFTAFLAQLKKHDAMRTVGSGALGN